MRVFDQRLYGSLNTEFGDTQRANGEWMLFLMTGQEPKTFSAAAQVFAVDDLNYLYNECVGVVPRINRAKSAADNTRDGRDIFLRRDAIAWFKGLSYYDDKWSIAIPDRISECPTNMNLTFCDGTGSKETKSTPGVTKTVLHYINPMNFVGFVSDVAASTTISLPTVTIDDVPVTLTRVSATLYTLPSTISGQTITLNAASNTVHKRLTPLVLGAAHGTAPEPTYCVLAPIMTKENLAWSGLDEIPYLITAVTTDTKEDALAYILGTDRSSQIKVVCRDLILGPLEA